MHRRPLDPYSDRPLYRQLADALRALIVSGRLKPGSPLLPEARIAHEYEVGIATVRRALAILRAEGRIETFRGVQARVRTLDDMTVITVEPGTRITMRAPSDDERREFGLPEGVQVFVLTRGGREQLHRGDRTVIEIPDG